MPIVPKFRCRVCTVYGAAYEEKKQEFLDELQVCLTKNKEPLLIGGDFNLVRSKKDKNNRVVDLKWCDKYNEWINKISLLQIELIGRGFTWSNNQKNVVMSHIDRVFYNTEFDAHYPLEMARALPSNPSDHVWAVIQES
jgi:exonuclease III